MRAPHLRAAFAIAVRWEGVVLALLPLQVMLLLLYPVAGLPPWGAPSAAEELFLGLSPVDWGVAAGNVLGGAAVVLLVPLVLDRRGLDFALLRRRPFAWIAAAALPYLLWKAMQAWELDSYGVRALPADAVFTTVLPAWLAGVLVADDLGAMRPGPAREVLGSAVLVALSYCLLVLGLTEVALGAVVDALASLSTDAVGWTFVAAFHASGWLTLVAQAWFLRRILAPAPTPAAAA